MQKFLLAIGLLLCCASVSHAQAEYPDVPLSDSAYADINLLSPTSDAINYCYGPVGPRAMTRYEFAVAIARSLERTTQQSNPVNFAALKRLGVKFLPELEMLGVDVEKIKINGVFLIEPKTAPTKTQVAPQFLDIPKSHWAFNSVEKLRLSRIVIGVQD